MIVLFYLEKHFFHWNY